MRRLLLIAFFLMPALVQAQTTVVTGTITDANGNAYASGTASAYKVVVSGQPAVPPVTVSTNASGFFTFSGSTNALPSPASYQFTVCAAPVLLGAPNTNPTPKQICFTSGPIAISGASQDISTTLNAIAPTLGPQGQGTNPTFINPTVTGTLTVPAPSNCANSVATGINTTLGATCTNSTGTGAWTVGAGGLTVSGTGTFTGPVLCKTLENTNCVDNANSASWAGSDACGWIQSAANALSTNGIVDARGLTGTQSCTTAFTVGSSHQVTLLLGAVTLTSSQTITLQQSSIIACPPMSSTDGTTNTICVIKQANGANLNPFINVAGNLAAIDGVEIDCNKANNTAGDCIQINNATFSMYRTAVARSAGVGIHLNCTGTTNQAQGAFFWRVRAIANASDGLRNNACTDNYSLQSDYENNGGFGINIIDGAGGRYNHNDIGGNTGGGVSITATSAVGFNAVRNRFIEITFQNNLGNDFFQDGNVSGAIVARNTIIEANHFGGLGATATGNTFDAIKIQNSTGNVVTGNIINSNSTATYKNGVELASPTDVEGRDTVFVNEFNGTFGNRYYVTVASTVAGVAPTAAPFSSMDNTTPGVATPLLFLDNSNVTTLAGHPTQKQINIQPFGNGVSHWEWLSDGSLRSQLAGDSLYLAGGAAMVFAEGANSGALATQDACDGNSTVHMIECSFNNGTFFPMGLTGNTGGTHSDSGFYQTATAAGCTTAASIGGVCATPITITWPVAFADANYKVTCTPVGAPTNLPSNPFVVTPIAASVTINYYAITAAAASWPNVNCEAVHN